MTSMYLWLLTEFSRKFWRRQHCWIQWWTYPPFLDFSGADNCKYSNEDRSIVHTSTKIGMDIPLGSLIGKLTFATWKFKMADIFQDGCNNRHDHIKFDIIDRFWLSLCPFICFWGCRSWIYNSKATQKLASIISSRSAGNWIYIGLNHKKGNLSISSIYCRNIKLKME